MKISIITVCYNSEVTIKETIESVLNQTYKNIEYIIIDGKSKDSTMTIVKEYDKKFSGRLKYISEEDNGIYDAMNKGIKLSTGEVIGILNSDDKLAHKDVVKRIVQEFSETNCDATYSNLVFMDEKSMTKIVRKFNAGKYSKMFGWHPPHPTLYVKKNIYDEIGKFNLKYKIAADYDFMLRMIKTNNYNLSYIDENLIYMRSGGASTDGLNGYIKNFRDSYQVLKDNKIKCAFIINCLRSVKTIMQMIFN